jgi:hypothetical protein
MDKLIHAEDKEKMMEDSKRLQFFNQELKCGFHKNIDELYIKFLTQHNEISDMHDISLVKEIFDFLKKNA